jgi:hypothetical protein
MKRAVPSVVIGLAGAGMGGIPLIYLIATGIGKLGAARQRARSKEADATISRVEELQRFGLNQAKVRVTYAVAPSDDASFEVSRETNVLLTQVPKTGQRVKVRYDPGNHEKFELITPTATDTGALLASMMRPGSSSAMASLAAMNGLGSAPPLGTGTFGAPTAQKRDPLDRLKELAELRDAGALTPSEFETQKAKILADT